MSRRVAMFALAALGAMALAGAVRAGSPAGGWYVSPEALWLSPDAQLHSESRTGFRVAIGKILDQEWDAELGYTQTTHPAKGGGLSGELKLQYAELDFKRVFHRDRRCNPFIDLGIGDIHSHYARVSGSADDEIGGKVGVGAFVGLFANEYSRIQLMTDAGVRFDAARSHGSPVDPYVAVGLRFVVGGAAAAAAPAVAAAVAAPAPAPAPAATPLPPPAPVDSDGDGVPDSLDKCPDTPAGDKVDEDGCSLAMNLQITFKTNSAQVDAAADAELDHFVQFLRDVPSARGELQGHTDNVGKTAYNLKLSQRRADAVKANVVAKGIDAARLTTKGYGDTQPAADNKNEDGRAQNRRVLFVRAPAQPQARSLH